MAWNYDRARERIDQLIRQRSDIYVEDVIGRLTRLRTESPSRLFSTKDALVSIPRDRAVLVDGVHVYARLSNYDDYRLESGSETEASHKRALAFLHLLYGAMDRIVDDFGAQRVDYHGARLHCVVIEPENNENARVLKALVLAQALQGLVRQANQEITRFDYDPKLRIGIDSGRCVAINDGTGQEQEPLFLGSAANYAAKLADGDGEGTFMSNRVRGIVGLTQLPGGLLQEKSNPLSVGNLVEFRTRAYAGGFDVPSNLTGDQEQLGRLINDWRADIRAQRSATGGIDAFSFHVHTPPLKSIDYAALSPGNSIRMPLASIFADLDGYTAYIDRCMATGNAGDAVRALHVLRGEFHNVLKSDFESRKVRYIGDCIHGVLAFGTPSSIDLAWTTREAVKCAAGLQGSFEIAQERLGGLDDLGLATGIEVGPTPISRIGIRGDRSVRVASSTATIQSQAEQENLEGTGIALGPIALSNLSLSAQRYFPNGQNESADYDTLAYALGLAASVSTNAQAAESDVREAEFRPHTPEFRPHAKG